MKKLYNLITASLYMILLTVVMTAVSCSDMDESYEKYLDEGEIIYGGKVDSVAPHTGKYRIELEMFVQSYRVSTVRVFWNDYADSADFAIEGPGVYKSVLNDMEERSYIFQLVSIDEFGNRSLPVEVSAFVYGDRYQARLVNRVVRSTSVDIAGVATISLGAADIATGAVVTEIKYTNLAGEEKVLSFPADEPTAIVADLKPNTTYAYRTVYRPDSTSIDAFYTAYAPGPDKFSLDKADWQIVAYSTQHGGTENRVVNVIDGTDATRWHSQAGVSSYPHFVTVDMGALRTITHFSVWTSVFDSDGADSRAPDEIQFLVSTDNTTWTDLGLFDFDRFLIGEQTYAIPTAPQARYFKFVGVSGPENNMVLGEISAYGY